jgi:hypothetical protein
LQRNITKGFSLPSRGGIKDLQTKLSKKTILKL